MLRAFGRMVALLLVAGGVCLGLPSATPLPVLGAIQPRPVAATGPIFALIDPKPLRLAPTPSPTPSPSSVPVAPRLSPTKAPTVGVGPRPIPPVIDAQELALVSLDTGRFLYQQNTRAAWAPASLT
ncbi:MAG TPA: hypothetical protein VHW91_03025, partial [Candidatus Dormibacteraeota bacterium]|nr:hypothetical protein [Candidatus Dormibacteraeota bacterium]